MSDAALLRISNLIKVEDDLQKIDTLRQQFVKEKLSIDTKLNTSTQQQIDSVIQNLTQLNTSARKLSDIKSNLDRMDSVYNESVLSMKDYDIFRNVVAVHETMMQVQNLYTDIANFRQYVDHINNMIDAEFQAVSQDIEYPLLNLYRIHFNVTQARNLLDYLEDESLTLSDDTQSIVQRIILPIRKVVRNFDELLKEIITNITEAVKDGNTELVTRLVRVIEHEAAEDLKLVLMSQLELVDQEKKKTVNYAKFRSKPRLYRKFFYDKLDESLTEIFNKCAEHFSGDPMAVYDNLDWLEDEMIFVERTLSPLFPAHWEIGDFVQKLYFNLLHKFTMSLLRSNPPAEDLMRILAYDSHYNSFITQLFGADKKKEQRSILGDDLKNTVLDDYMKVIVIKMEEWNNNLIAQETRTFKERDEAPDVYAYEQTIEDLDEYDHVVTKEIMTDVYVLPDFRTTLSLLKEQADVAADSGYGKVLVGVIENWAKCYNERVSAFLRLVEDEVTRYMSVYNNEACLMKESKTKRFLRMQSSKLQPEYDVDNMTAEELAKISKPGLLDYLTALGNMYEINTERLQDKFLPAYKDKVHSTYQDRIVDAFESTLLPATELNAQIIRALADIIINDLLPALSIVFTSKWYDSDKALASGELNMAQRIVETIVEYMEELRCYATYEIYNLTFTVVLDTLISSYLRIGYQNILHSDGKKIDPKATKKYKSFSEMVNRDVGIIYEGLDQLFSRKDAVYLMKSLSALEFLTAIATCDDPFEEIPGMWEHEILDTYYNCSVEYVRGALLCRKDVDPKQIPPLIDRLVAIQKEYQSAVDPPEMSVVTLNNFSFT